MAHPAEITKLVKLKGTLEKMLSALQSDLNKLDIEWTQLCVISEDMSQKHNESTIDIQQKENRCLDDITAINEIPIDVSVTNLAPVKSVKQSKVIDEEFDSSDED